MIPWFHSIEYAVRDLAALMPLELFTFFGGFIEEVVAPIPAMLIMTTAGLFAHLEGRTMLFVVWIVLLGDIGKTLGSWLYYILGDKLEDFVIGKCGRFIGLSHADIEKVGQRFNGNHWRDGSVIFLLRAIPFFPTAVISIACGVIKINMRTFLIASYLGNFCKDLFYASAGYYGARALRALFLDIERMRWGLGLFITVLCIGLIFFLYIHRHHGLRFFNYLCSRWRE